MSTSSSPPSPEPNRPSLRRRLIVIAPWVGLVVINLLYVLPTALDDLQRAPAHTLGFSGEIITILTVGVLTAHLRYRRAIWSVLLVFALVVWLFLWDIGLGRMFLKHPPLLYDQLFLAKHLFVLIGDIWSWGVAGVLLAVAIAIVITARAARWSLRSVVDKLASFSGRTKATIFGPIWLLVLFSALTKSPFEPRIVWGTPQLISNLQASVHMHHAVTRQVEASPYADYASIELERKPDVMLFLIESYGRMLFDDKSATKQWTRLMKGFEGSLRQQGWSMVSGFSTAPVSGGRSWLAETTVLTGVRVRWEAIHRHLVDDIDQLPNIVGFLQRQGYDAKLLAPSMRERRGVELDNRWHYDTTIYFNDLLYTGPDIGWGKIPDQYSLEYAQEHFFAAETKPMFVNFHMVSSHAPWRAVARVTSDYRELNGTEDSFDHSMDEKNTEGLGEFVTRMKRYRRVEPRFTYMGEMDSLKVRNYWKTIRYDLQTISRYLNDNIDRDRILIVMGDHQPPFISGNDKTYDVPVHIFARDSAMLDEFREVGFIDGLILDGNEHPAVVHEGIFSLFMRALVRCCAVEGTPMPEYHRFGQRME